MWGHTISLRLKNWIEVATIRVDKTDTPSYHFRHRV